MKPPIEQNPEPASHKRAIPPLLSNDEEGGADTCNAERLADTSAFQEGESSAVTDKELARSLAEVNALPRQFSRSCLVPLTEHLLKLKQEKYSYRFMAKWLHADHGIVVKHSTVFRFVKKARQDARRAQRAFAAKKGSLLPEQAPASQIPICPSAVPPHPKQIGVSQAAEAIRAVKAQAKEAKPSNHTSSPSFNPNEPLLRSKHKPN